MQVLQWLFKAVQDQQPAKDDHHKGKKPSIKRETSKEVVVCQKQKRVAKKAQKPDETSLDCRNFRYLALLLRSRGKSSRTYFYSTLNQKTLEGLHNLMQQKHFINSVKMKKEDLVQGLGLGHKILPIGDSSSSSMSSDDDQRQCGPSDHEKARVKGKAKNMSRMKELLRWTAASKAEKRGKFETKGMRLRSRAATRKSEEFDEELSNGSNSNKSLTWKLESHKTGHWITTDDEFVVLEL